MKVLVINAGSSSIKYQLIDMRVEEVMAKGLCERIGLSGNIVHKTSKGGLLEKDIPMPTHNEAFQAVIDALTKGEHAVISDLSEVAAVGHRVVQGGERFTQPAQIDDAVLGAILDYTDLAPLHNPPTVTAIRACMKVFPASVPQIAVFDTTFHTTMPREAYMFGVPYSYYEKYRIRRYGFHGTSHRFVSAEVIRLLGKKAEDTKIVTCHLGNGCSITAVKGGQSIDTSMGFTPLDGIIMGTRSGGIDPSIVTFLVDKEGKTGAEVSNLLNKESGYIGLSELSSDHRDLVEAAKSGNERARMTLEIQAYQIRKYIGSYAAAMGGLDAVVFTGGIGENSFYLRDLVMQNLEFLGIEMDRARNEKCEVEITAPSSRTKVFVVPTNEELMIARDTIAVIGQK